MPALSPFLLIIARIAFAAALFIFGLVLMKLLRRDL